MQFKTAKLSAYRLSLGMALATLSLPMLPIHSAHANTQNFLCNLHNGYQLPKDVELYAFCSFVGGTAPAHNYITDKYGTVNQQGKVVIPFEYDTLVDFWQGKALVKKNEKWLIINLQNQTLATYDFEDASGFNNGIAEIKQGGKWGFINSKGEVIIKPQFDDILQGFSTLSLNDKTEKNIAIFEQNHKHGIVNIDGKIIVPPEYDDIRPQDEIIQVMKDGKIGFYDYQGKLLYPAIYERRDGFYSSGKWTKYNWLSLEKDGKVGAINKYGRLVVPIEYDNVNLISTNSFSVLKDGKYGIYANNQLIYPLVFDEIGEYTEKFLRIKKDGQWGFLDHSNSLMMVDYAEVQNYSEGMVGVAKVTNNGKKWGYIDQLGNEVIEPKYDVVMPFHQGLASVTYADKVGVIDFEGYPIVPFEYDGISQFENGYAIVSKEVSQSTSRKSEKMSEKLPESNEINKTNTYKYGIINTQGKIVVDIDYEEVTQVAEGMVGVKKEGKWGFVNQQGELIFPYQLGQVFDEFSEGILQVDNCYDSEENEILCDTDNRYTENLFINKQGKVLRSIRSFIGEGVVEASADY